MLEGLETAGATPRRVVFIAEQTFSVRRPPERLGAATPSAPHHIRFTDAEMRKSI